MYMGLCGITEALGELLDGIAVEVPSDGIGLPIDTVGVESGRQVELGIIGGPALRM